MSLFSLKHVSKIYFINKKPFNALTNISLDISNKGLLSIVGKSGSGKSTLLNLIMGIEKPSKGEIFFNEKDINKFNEKEALVYKNQEISMVFQHYNLFDDLTGYQNVLLALSMHKGHDKEKKVKSLFEEFNLEYLLNQKCKFMSGGEKQRIAILRALVTNPKAMLCDEPTGALDVDNSLAIMRMFKEISKTKLVVMVSHNKELVERFSDQIIKIKDGHIVSITGELENTEEEETKIEDYSDKWSAFIKRMNIKRNIYKNILSFIICSISYASIFLSIGFAYGSKKSQESALKDNLEINYATVSQTEYYEIENSPLSYQKSLRPSVEMVDEKLANFNSVVCEQNLSYLFTNYPFGKFNKKELDSFEMVPLYSFDNPIVDSLCVESCEYNNDFYDVIVNEEFVKLLGINNNEAIDNYVDISYSTSVSYSTGSLDNPFIKDVYSYSYKFRIYKVVKEFSFLNTPKIYYSYNYLKDKLKQELMENLSQYFGYSISFYSYIEKSRDDEPQTGYSYYLFINDINEIDSYFKLIENLNSNKSDFIIESKVYSIFDSYKEFIDSFSDALLIFVGIAFIGINCILGIISLSTFIKRKKESAILSCLGAKKSTITEIFVSENLLVVVFSLVFGLLLSLILEKKIDALLYKSFSFKNLISIPFLSLFNIPMLLPIIALFLSVVCTLLFTLIPIKFYKANSIVEELRDE